MVGSRSWLRSLLWPAPVVSPGLYHYRRELGDHMLRLHLRVDPGGGGVLSVNAKGVIHLNETAAMLVKIVLDGTDRTEAVQRVRRAYRANVPAIERDYDRIVALVDQLETSEDACPLMYVDSERVRLFGVPLSAPYRADLALTYACNNDCRHCYVSRQPSEITPLELQNWERVLHKLWDVGVPHVCFTGGEATLSPQLPALIEAAEDIGQITGLLTNGRRLSDNEFTRDLCAAGLDHVQVTLESADSATHDAMVGCAGAFAQTVRGIRNALAEDIYLLTNTTLCKMNVAQIRRTLEFVRSLGVQQVAMNSIIATGRAPESGLELSQSELELALTEVTAAAEDLGLRFTWYSPTRYCELNPLQFGLGPKRCTAAEYNICIEPDGQVLPCQSYFETAGNILRDSWETIWNGELFQSIRSRTKRDEPCVGCPDFDVCGGGCPLSAGTSFVCSSGMSEG